MSSVEHLGSELGKEVFFRDQAAWEKFLHLLFLQFCIVFLKYLCTVWNVLSPLPKHIYEIWINEFMVIYIMIHYALNYTEILGQLGQTVRL